MANLQEFQELPTLMDTTTASRRPTALLMCFHYPPSTEVAARRLAAFAAGLEAAGYEAVIIAGAPRSQPIAQTVDHPGPNVTVVRIRQPRRLLVGLLVSGKRLVSTTPDDGSSAAGPDDTAIASARKGIAGRLKAGLFAVLLTMDVYKKWAWLAFLAAVHDGRKRDVRVVIASGPPFTGVASAWLAAKRLGVPFIADYRDPLSVGCPKIHTKWWGERALSRWLEHHVMAGCASVTCASPGILAGLTAGYPDAASRAHLVMNGYDGSIDRRPQETGHRLDILFAGALYLNRDPFEFLAAVERLVEQPQIQRDSIRIRFVGHCESFRGARLADWLASREARHVVQVLPPVSETTLKPLIRESTVLLNLAQGQPRQIPAKTFEHLASGCEVLALCEPDSDTGRLIQGIPGMHQVTPGDDAGLDRVLSDLYRRHVVEGVIEQAPEDVVRGFSRAAQTRKLLEVVSEVTRHSASS